MLLNISIGKTPELWLASNGKGSCFDSLSFPVRQDDSRLLNPEMIEDTAKIVNEPIKDKVQVNLIINNRAGGNAPLIAQKIADRLHSQKQQSLF